MRFVVLELMPDRPAADEPTVVLAPDDWDDYGWRTLFHATLVVGENLLPLGPVKIMSLDQEGGRTPLPTTFRRLGPGYCSVGQDPDYYARIFDLPYPVRVDYLTSIRDAAYDPSVLLRFAPTEGWQTSLLRFGQAESSLAYGVGLFAMARPESAASFGLELPNGPTVPFAFEHDTDVPGRLNVVIGYNGVGKTRLLGDIAVAASRVGSRDHGHGARLTGVTRTFGSVVAVSYSAFDDFELPIVEEEGSTGSFGYHYCGLRRIDGPRRGGLERYELKGPDELFEEFRFALDEARRGRDGGRSLAAALRAIEGEASFGRIGVTPSDLVGGAAQVEVFRTLSTGHKIVLHILAQLGAHLRPQSLALIDEPEAHLHPPLLSALLKAVLTLLDEYDSYAVVATHSPVVLQEVPARHVRVLSRFEDQITVSTPEIETFGEAIGAITRYVFSLDSGETDYQGVLRRLAATYRLEEIEHMFDAGLSTQARALVLRYQDEQRRT